jgi:hypothetical protein
MLFRRQAQSTRSLRSRAPAILHEASAFPPCSPPVAATYCPIRGSMQPRWRYIANKTPVLCLITGHQPAQPVVTQPTRPPWLWISIAALALRGAVPPHHNSHDDNWIGAPMDYCADVHLRIPLSYLLCERAEETRVHLSKPTCNLSSRIGDGGLPVA